MLYNNHVIAWHCHCAEKAHNWLHRFEHRAPQSADAILNEAVEHELNAFDEFEAQMTAAQNTLHKHVQEVRTLWA